MSQEKVKEVLMNGMTVEQLQAELVHMPIDAVVLFTSNYGDRGRTEQAIPVGSVEEIDYSERLYDTAYSESGIAVGQNDDGEGPMLPEGEDLAKAVVLLRRL